MTNVSTMAQALRLPLLVGTTAALLGCGGGEEPTRSGRATPAPASSSAADGAPARAKVRIAGFEYLPPEVTVRAGGQVVFTDEDSTNHTVTFARTGASDIRNIRAGQRKTVQVSKRGRFAYVCEFHPTMRGVIVAR